VFRNSTVLENPTENASGNTAAIRIEHTKELRVPLILNLTEALLETAINVAFTQLLDAPTREMRRDAWEEFAGLVRQRSPECVARMEQERGLR
jgi:oligoendopeptidase F